MAYYATDADGNITSFSTTPKPYLPLQTDEAIVYGPGGGLFFASQVPPDPGPTPEELEAAFSAAIEAYLNEFVQMHHWIDMDRALAQKGAFIQDSKDAQAAYDDVWLQAIALMPQVLDGTMPIDEAMSLMPELVWTDGTGLAWRVEPEEGEEIEEGADNGKS